MAPSASLHNELVSAKRQFVASAIPLDPLNLVRHRPWATTVAVASVTMVAGALSGGPMVRLLTSGWLARGLSLAVDFAKKHAMPFADRAAANAADKNHAVG